MESTKSRALLIGLAGPVLQVIGLAWFVAHLYLQHAHEALTARHIIFEPSLLVFAAGIAVALVAVPAAIDVAQARPEEVAVGEPQYEGVEGIAAEPAHR